MSHLIQLSATGFTSVNLAGSSAADPYVIPTGGWSPAVARQPQTVLGGRGTREPVDESFVINIYGASQAAVLAAYRDLVVILDQATIWGRTGAGEPVTYTIQLDGGTSMQALVIDAPDLPRAPVEFLEDLDVFAMRGVEVRFTRQGEMLGATESASSSSAAVGTLHSVALDVETPAPLNIKLGTINTTNVNIVDAGRLFFASDAADIQVIEGEALSPGGTYASVADGGNNARGSSVLRFTPSTSNNYQFTNSTTLSLPSGVRRFAAYAVVRTNATLKNYQIIAGLHPGSADRRVESRGSIITGTSTNPQIVSLGVIARPNDLYTRFFFKTLAFETGGSIDIDYLVLVAIRPYTTGIIKHDSINIGNAFGAGQLVELMIDQQVLSKPAPIFGVRNTSQTEPIPFSYSGDLAVRAGGANVYVLWMVTGATRWRLSTGAGSVVTVALTATAYNGYLTPQ